MQFSQAKRTADRHAEPRLVRIWRPSESPSRAPSWATLVRKPGGAAVSGGFPFADFLQAPALLDGCGVVAAGSAGFEAFGDLGAVSLRVVVVVFELGGNACDVKVQAADS